MEKVSENGKKAEIRKGEELGKKRLPSFLIKKTETGIKFRLKAPNGEAIADSEVYSSLAACQKGIRSVIANASIANLEDQTKKGYGEENNPKFELYLDKAGEYRFRLRAKNGEIITFSEGYTQKSACQKGIDAVRKYARDAVVEPVSGGLTE